MAISVSLSTNEITVTETTVDVSVDLVGVQGAVGPVATITVGTVGAVDYPGPGSVTNSGSAGAAVLDFELVTGMPGSLTPEAIAASEASIAAAGTAVAAAGTAVAAAGTATSQADIATAQAGTATTQAANAASSAGAAATSATAAATSAAQTANVLAAVDTAGSSAIEAQRYAAEGSVLDNLPSHVHAAETLLKQAVWWIDAAHSASTDAAATNLGWGGSALNAAQGTAASQPKKLDWTGTNYVYLPGVVSNYLSVPDEAALDITGDIDIRVQVALDDWTPAATNSLLSKWESAGSAQSYRLYVSTGGILTLIWCYDGIGGVRSVASTVVTGIADGTAKWVRATVDVDNGAGQYEGRFYLSDDGVTWTQLGATVTGVTGVTSIAATATAVNIGARITGTSEVATGKFYRAIIKNGIDGPTVLDVDCSQVLTGAATTFTARTGQAVTINRSTSGRKSVAVTQPCWLFGTDDFMTVADNDLLDFTATDSFTILWIGRQWGTIASGSALISKAASNAGTANAKRWLVRTGTLSTDYLILDDGTNIDSLEGTVTATLGGLGVIAEAVSTTTITPYYNAASGTASARAAGDLTNANPVQIGNFGATGYADMEFISAAVFRRVLTQDEISLLNTYYQGLDLGLYQPPKYPTAARLPATVTAGNLAYQQDAQRLLIGAPGSTYRWISTVVNLLTANQASIETDTTGWAAGTSSAIARSTAAGTFLYGVASLSLTRTGTTGTATTNTPTGASGIPVVAGRVYTALFWVKAATDARAITPAILWYKSDGSASATASSSGTAVTDATAAWSLCMVTAVAPADAAFAAVRVSAASVVVGELHYVDKIGFWEGAGGVWQPGGERIDPGTLGHYWDETVGRRELVWDTVNSRWQMVYGDTGWRDVTSLLAATITTPNPNSTALMRRIGALVHFRYSSGASPTATGSSVVMIGTTPTGFTTTYGITAPLANASTFVLTTSGLLASTSIYLTNPTSGVQTAGGLIWTTTEAWPATLPGTASGSIPSA